MDLEVLHSCLVSVRNSLDAVIDVVAEERGVSFEVGKCLPYKALHKDLKEIFHEEDEPLTF